MLIIISGAGQRAKDGKGVMANNKVENICNFFFSRFTQQTAFLSIF